MMKWYWFDKAPPLLLPSSLLDHWQGINENNEKTDNTTYWEMLDLLESQSSLTSPCIELPIQNDKGLIINTSFRFTWLEEVMVLVCDEYSYNIESETGDYFKDFNPDNLIWTSQLYWKVQQTDYVLINSALSLRTEGFSDNRIFIKFKQGNYCIESASVKAKKVWFEFLRFRFDRALPC